MIIDPRVTRFDHVDEIRAEIDQLRDEIGEADEIACETLAELRQWIEWDLHTKVLLEGRRYGEVMVELGRMTQEEL